MIESFQDFFDRWELTSGSVVNALITAAVVITLSLLAYFITAGIFRRIAKRSADLTVSVAWRKFKRPVFFVILLIDFIILKELFMLEEKTLATVNQVIKVAIVFMVTWLVIRAINLVREVVLKRYDIGDPDNLVARKVATQLRVLERIVIFLVILIAIAVALMTFEGIKRIGISLFASAGVAGIIIGFAAQRLLGSILAGFQIALTQPIRIDDVVIVEGEWGWIEEITLTYVVVRIWDKRRLIVPTTYFIEKPFQNWTRVSADILGSVFIYTDYQVPVDKLRSAFLEILKESEHWDGNVGVVQVTDATDHAVEIRALMSAADSPTAWNLRVEVREKLIGYLQAHFPNSLPRTRVVMTGEPGKVVAGFGGKKEQ